MHYSRHRLTASVAYVTTLAYASTSNQCALSACPLVSSSKTKPCQFHSVQLRCSVRSFNTVLFTVTSACQLFIKPKWWWWWRISSFFLSDLECAM